MSTSFRNRIGVSVVLIQAILLASVGGKWNPSPVPDPNAPAHFPKNQALWQQWCSGGSHRYTACFQRTDGDMHDDLTVSNDAAGHTVLSEDGKFSLLFQQANAEGFTMDDKIWRQWCPDTKSSSEVACFHLTSGGPQDFSVSPEKHDQIVFSSKGHYFGAKCPTGTDPLVITVDGIGDITIKGPVKYQGKDCCSLIMTVIGKHYPKTVCPGDPAIEFPANL
ncbi:hypothetical protein BCV70DRAFT_236917 [Testicularia cyperi]|uniref:Uncharacterized protein n=1 Tax=Testicularia cyperi TaxID=1882483 RepID=A0A317XRN0_9BASI|nr:hypothetical protein BCV70DRAFT_236917 [Testicularia cyperi]